MSQNDNLILPEPLLIQGFFNPALLSAVQLYFMKVRNGPPVLQDTALFHRDFLYNDPFLCQLHKGNIKTFVTESINAFLKPSYSFASFYHQDKGVCPVHIDRPQCYLTIDVCIHQKEVWPLYINSNHDYTNRIDTNFTTDQNELNQIKKDSAVFLLRAGDAVIYHGAAHPHWRDTITPGNSCDLLFFHFVPENFQGSLE